MVSSAAYTEFRPVAPSEELDRRAEELLSKLDLDDKLGQMSQLHAPPRRMDECRELAAAGRMGSFLNADLESRMELQKLAVERSPRRIPLIFGRDVIHGYRTIFPIPLGQAATFNPELVEQAAAVAAREAASQGIDWTFAPMVDIARDPRWGRVAESPGEDVLLTSAMGVAMVRGFQGPDLSDLERIAACAKHFVGYGAAEAGKDYNTTLIPERALRDVYLAPFKACVDAGVATLMSAFNDLNGIPASVNEFTLRKVLKEEWGFRGFVVSDWQCLTETLAHGFCEDQRQAAFEGARAGVDMEMVSRTFASHLPELIAEGRIRPEIVDASVRAILRVKLALGLFDHPYRSAGRQGVILHDSHRRLARAVARQSLVLLKNDGAALPLSAKVSRLAVIGPLADSPREQLGCWIPDGRESDSVTPLAALREALPGAEIRYAPGLPAASSRDTRGFDDAVHAARGAEATLLFLGEEAFLSGEAHSRAFIDLPGAQEALLRAVAGAGRPLIVIVLAGRPLVLGDVIERADAVIYAWHPGTMAGPALADVLLGVEPPSGRLPVSLPRAVGQVPVYYAHKNSGRPPKPGAKGVPTGTPLDPSDFSTRHLDVETAPLFPFGYGLGYSRFEYSDLRLSAERVPIGGRFQASIDVTNAGPVAATEVVQLYVRDLVGSVTRPVKELKGFERVEIAAGATRRVAFTLHTGDLAFWGRDMTFAEERGHFHLWIGPNSTEGPRADFELV